MCAAKSKRLDVPAFGMAIMQGRAMNPATGQLFLLAGDDGTRIVVMQREAGRDFIGDDVAQNMLPDDLVDRPGLAFHPATKHRFIFNAEVPKLHGLTPADERVTSLNIIGKTMDIPPQAVVYTPGLGTDLLSP